MLLSLSTPGESISLAFLASQSLLLPSPNDLGSDLTIIINNDLLGPESPSADSRTILLTPQFGVASLELNTSNIQPILDYLTSQGKYTANQQFWIASTANTSRAIDGHGNIADTTTSLSSHRVLPALCTHSAPLSNSACQNTTTQWQVTVHLNHGYITGSQCMQSGEGGPEDCLFLNIWTTYSPAHAGSKKSKSVRFWIRGGAFTGGTANDPTIDGGNIASRGEVVMCAINCRLSTLGFLALNVDFGDDPDRITTFGQSAGVASVRAMLASPKSMSKFTGAIPSSNLGGGGYGTTNSSWLSSADLMRTAVNPIMDTTNGTTVASQVDCLRNAPTASLVTGTVVRYLVVDGTYLTSSSLILNGTGANLSSIHLMQGLMRDDDSAIILYIQTKNLSKSITKVGSTPRSSTNTSLVVFNVTSRVATDSISRCFNQASAYEYFYEFNKSYQARGWNSNSPVCDGPRIPSHPNGDLEGEYFKCHSGEL
ncbi:cholinesterase [Hyaloscypha finlandica]|nr:cholinesterase [Hyaloscypha finlandica]